MKKSNIIPLLRYTSKALFVLLAFSNFSFGQQLSQLKNWPIFQTGTTGNTIQMLNFNPGPSNNLSSLNAPFNSQNAPASFKTCNAYHDQNGQLVFYAYCSQGLLSIYNQNGLVTSVGFGVNMTGGLTNGGFGGASSLSVSSNEMAIIPVPNTCEKRFHIIVGGSIFLLDLSPATQGSILESIVYKPHGPAMHQEHCKEICPIAISDINTDGYSIYYIDEQPSSGYSLGKCDVKFNRTTFSPIYFSPSPTLLADLNNTTATTNYLPFTFQTVFSRSVSEMEVSPDQNLVAFADDNNIIVCVLGKPNNPHMPSTPNNPSNNFIPHVYAFNFTNYFSINSLSVSGVEFNHESQKIVFSIYDNTKSTPYGDIGIWDFKNNIQPVFKNYGIIPEPYSKSQIELGRNNELFICSSNSISTVNNLGNTVAISSVTTSTPDILLNERTCNSSVYDNIYILPDQVDGFDFNSNYLYPNLHQEVYSCYNENINIQFLLNPYINTTHHHYSTGNIYYTSGNYPGGNLPNMHITTLGGNIILEITDNYESGTLYFSTSFFGCNVTEEIKINVGPGIITSSIQSIEACIGQPVILNPECNNTFPLPSPPNKTIWDSNPLFSNLTIETQQVTPSTAGPFQFKATCYTPQPTQNYPTGCKISETDFVINTVPPPSATSSLHSDNVTCNSIRINWNSVQNAIGYHLMVTHHGQTQTEIDLETDVIAPLNFYTVTNLSPNINYNISIVPFKGPLPYVCDGAVAQITTSTLSLPSAPAIGAATNITCDGFRANWTTTSGLNYFIDVSLQQNFSSFVSINGIIYQNYPAQNASSISITGLEKGRTYFYRVRSSQSNILCAGNPSSYASITLPTPTANLGLSGEFINGIYNICHNDILLLDGASSLCANSWQIKVQQCNQSGTITFTSPNALYEWTGPVTNAPVPPNIAPQGLANYITTNGGSVYPGNEILKAGHYYLVTLIVNNHSGSHSIGKIAYIKPSYSDFEINGIANGPFVFCSLPIMLKANTVCTDYGNVRIGIQPVDASNNPLGNEVGEWGDTYAASGNAFGYFDNQLDLKAFSSNLGLNMSPGYYIISVDVRYYGAIVRVASKTIQILPLPSSANAGPDKKICGNTMILEADTPLNGSGVWSITNGTGGNIINPSSPHATLTGVYGTTYTLNWTVINSCGISMDNVNISFVKDYINGNDAYWRERCKGFNEVCVGNKFYQWNSADEQYTRIDQGHIKILIPDLDASGHEVLATTFYGYSPSAITPNADNFQWDNETLLNYANTHNLTMPTDYSSIWDDDHLFVSPHIYGVHLTMYHLLDINSPVIYSAPNIIGSYTSSYSIYNAPYYTPSSSPQVHGAGNYHWTNWIAKSWPGNVDWGTSSDHFIQQNRTLSGCATEYGKGWRLPTDNEVGHVNDNAVTFTPNLGYHNQSSRLLTTSSLYNPPSGSIWEVLISGQTATAQTRLIQDQVFPQVRCVFNTHVPCVASDYNFVQIINNEDYSFDDGLVDDQSNMLTIKSNEKPPFNAQKSGKIDSLNTIATINSSHTNANNVEISVYPNPTSSYVEISYSNSEMLDFVLLDAKSSIVISGKVKSGDRLNLKTLPTGIYILKTISNLGSTHIEKIIKN